MHFFNLLSLRQQIWAGFISVLLMITLIGSISFYRLTQLQHQASQISNYSQPAMLSALALKERIQTTTSLMGSYIINKTPEYEKKFNDSISQLKTSLQEYKMLPAIKDSKKMQQDTLVLENHIKTFIKQQDTIDYLIKNTMVNYPGIRIANTKVNPYSKKILQILSTMIESELEEVTSERRDFLQLLIKTRHNWMIITSLVRTFLALPTPSGIKRLTTYKEQQINFLNSVNDNASLFNLEQEDGAPKLNKLTGKYFSHVDEIFNLSKNNQWRADVSLIKKEIRPTIDKINAQIDAMINYQKQQVNVDNKALISKTETTLTQITIALVLSLLIGIFTAKFTSKQINTLIIETKGILKNILDGDFSLKMNENRAKDIAELAHMTNDFSERLKNIIGEINTSLLDLHSTSDNMTAVATKTSDSIFKQNKETEMVSSAIEEVSITSKDVTRNIATAFEAAKQADSSAQAGVNKSNVTLQSMNELIKNLDKSAHIINDLKQNTNEINTFLEIIQSISEQTNLLALNAAIEAARAGDQGRGFAVVADEVRTLASRTQESTNQIKELIDRLQDGAENAVIAMTSSIKDANSNNIHVEETTDYINKIKGEIVNINSVLEQVASASKQLSTTSNGITENVASIRNISETTSHSTESLKIAGLDLTKTNQRLDKVVSVFQNKHH